MREEVISFLEKNKIIFKEFFHQPTHKVSDSINIKNEKMGLMTKSLFLEDENSQLYLISLVAEKRLDIKKLKSVLNIKKLKFVSPERMKKEINVSPGNVSIFSIINSDNILLIVDKDLFNSSYAGFHPNENSSTLRLDKENLERFYNLVKNKKMILDL